MPAAAAIHEASWRRLLRHAPIMTAAEHAARVGVKEIEEVIGCSLCGDDRLQPLFTPEGRNGKWRYHVVRCPNCGFLYRHPGIRPERLGELYAGRYDKFLTGRYARKRQRRYRMVMAAFVELAHERGFDGYGVDLSPSSVERARQRPGGRNAYFGAPLDVPEIAAGGFDVITLWSVMAHLPRPIDDLRMLRGLLAPGGALLILTVNANSLRLKAERDEWNGFTPNHLKFFSPSTLALALEQAGFRATAMPPLYSYEVERGQSGLTPRDERRLRRVIDRGNRGNMLRAAAFDTAEGPARWGLDHRGAPISASSSAIA
jgi:SAM-dependent methyltransferase